MSEHDADTIANKPADAETDSSPTKSDEAALLERLESVEDLVRDIRGIAERNARENRHQDFSPFRAIAGIAQAIAIILLMWCVVEFAFVEAGQYSTIFFRLAFAIMTQLIAITMLLADRDRG